MPETNPASCIELRIGCLPACQPTRAGASDVGSRPVACNDGDSISIQDIPDEIHPRRIIGDLPRKHGAPYRHLVGANPHPYKLSSSAHEASISEQLADPSFGRRLRPWTRGARLRDITLSHPSIRTPGDVGPRIRKAPPVTPTTTPPSSSIVVSEFSRRVGRLCSPTSPGPRVPLRPKR